MPDNQVIPSIALGNHSFRTRLQMLFLLIMTLSARAYLRNADLQQVHSYSLILANGEWLGHGIDESHCELIRPGGRRPVERQASWA